MSGIPVHVVDQDTFDAWRAELPSGPDFRAAVKAKIEEIGETLLVWYGPGRASFMWMCPGCGSTYAGRLGDHPVSGWESPQWVNTGTREQPTLQPSLGCGLWRRGECDGHYWLRDGKLETA